MRRFIQSPRLELRPATAAASNQKDVHLIDTIIAGASLSDLPSATRGRLNSKSRCLVRLGSGGSTSTATSQGDRRRGGLVDGSSTFLQSLLSKESLPYDTVRAGTWHLDATTRKELDPLKCENSRFQLRSLVVSRSSTSTKRVQTNVGQNETSSTSPWSGRGRGFMHTCRYRQAERCCCFCVCENLVTSCHRVVSVER